MQQERKILRARPVLGLPLDQPAEAGEILRRAISMKLCALAVYNKALVKLAPHILYTRHDDPFVDAIVLERDGKPPRETKLGVFKLSGLKDLRLTGTSFSPLPFDAAGEKYAGTTLQAVEA